jgi:hypothetical protein
MKHRTSNIQHRTSNYLAVLVILLLALVRPAGAQITTSPGGGTGTVSSNDVWQIIQDIGVGGGVVSNAFVEFVIDTWYTNTTEYPALASAIVNLQTPGAGGLQTATVQMELDLGANETTDVMRRAYFTSDSGSGFSDSRELGNYIPAGARYRWWIASGSAIIDNTAPFGGYLVYFGSGGGGGSVDSSTLVLRNNGVSTNQTLVDATFEGTTSFEAIIADSLVGDGAGLTNVVAKRAARATDSVQPPFMRLNKTPPIGFGAWGVFTTEFGSLSNWGTNSLRWLTNVIALVKEHPQLTAAGVDTLFIDDGWQHTSRDLNGDLTWRTNAFPIGIPAIVQLAHEAGLKLHLYTSIHTLTCMGLPGSGTNNIYRDVQKMMSWGVDGVMVDTCNTPVAGNEPLLEEFAFLTASAIRDFQAAAFATNAEARPFFVHMTTGNGPGTLPQVITFQGLNFYDAIGVSTGYSDTTTIPALTTAGKNNLRLLKDWIKPGHFPMFSWFYSGNVDSTWEMTRITNVVNVGIMICGMGKLGIGDRVAQWVPGGDDLGGYGPGPQWQRFTNYWLPIFGNKELIGLWKDPAVLPGKVVVTNAATELWVRKIGHEYSNTNVIFLANSANTNFSFTLTTSQFGGQSNTIYALRDPWTQTTIATFANAISLSVPSSNGVLYTVFPDAAVKEMTGTTLALDGGWYENLLTADKTVSGFTFNTASNQIARANWTVVNTSGSDKTVTFPPSYSINGNLSFVVSNGLVFDFLVERTSVRTQITHKVFSFASPFSPADISGLVAWYRPEDLTSYAAGDPITTWPDASGNGFAATNVSGAAPFKVASSIGGLPGASFQGTRHLRHLIGDYATSTIFAVIQQTNTLSGYRGVFYAGAATSAGTMMLANLNTANKWGVYTTVEQAAATQLTAANTPILLSMVDNGASGGTFYTNGVSNGTWTGNTIGSSEPTLGGSSAQIFNGYISEVIFYGSPLGSDDRQAVESYLKSKYGLP